MINIATYLLSKQYVDRLLLEKKDELQGQSAYEIALQNGFVGTETEWLASLQGITPHIGDNGNWFIGEVDTGVLAKIDLEQYYSEANLIALTTTEIVELCQ